MMRNLGGAIGIAALQTFETKREQFHSNVLMQAVSLFEPATRARIAALMRYFLDHGVADQALATHKAIVAIGLRVRQQASIMAFSDTFYLLGIALFIALVASLFFQKQSTFRRRASERRALASPVRDGACLAVI